MTATKLLIVDDDGDLADGLAEVLELEGYNVDVTFTGESGIEAANRKCYDVILMDVGLPGMNGAEALHKIKLNDPRVLCFLLTGYSADHIAERGIRANAFEILTKPIDLAELIQRLSRIEHKA